MSTALQRKVSKVLSSRYRVDDDLLRESLEGLSAFYPEENSASTRRQLKTTLEQRCLINSKSLVSAFGQAKTELEQAETAINELQQDCIRITNQLRKAQENTSRLIKQSSELEKQKHDALNRQHLVTAFLQRFSLTEQDIALLESEEVDKQFLTVLTKIAHIRQEVSGLLDSEYQRVGLDILDSVSRRQEAAYEKCFRWVQTHARTLHADDAGTRQVFIQALLSLRDMPVYFDHCCQEISQSRRLLLIRRFIEALTRGAGVGHQPIELHAHDSVRYVSDMLGWIHQTIAAERDFFNNLITSSPASSSSSVSSTSVSSSSAASSSSSSSSPGTAAIGSKADADTAAAAGVVVADPEKNREEVIASLMSNTFEGVVRPLKTRVEQVLVSCKSSVVLYQINKTIGFYRFTVDNLLTPGVGLTQVLEDLQSLSESNFYSSLQATVDKLAQSGGFASYSQVAVPSRQVVDFINQLDRILAACSAAALTPTSSDSELVPILEAMADPLVAMAASTVAGFDISDAAVYQINLIDELQQVLHKYKFVCTNARHETLALAMQGHVDDLTSHQASLMLRKCGLSDCTVSCKQVSLASPLSQQPGCSAENIRVAMSSFLQSLANGSLIMPSCDSILNPSVRQQARKGVLVAIAQDLQCLYQAVMDPANGYQDPASLLPHTPKQIKGLLGLGD